MLDRGSVEVWQTFKLTLIYRLSLSTTFDSKLGTISPREQAHGNLIMARDLESGSGYITQA